MQALVGAVRPGIRVLYPGDQDLRVGEEAGTRAHGSNESLHLATFERACLAEALLLRNLAGQ